VVRRPDGTPVDPEVVAQFNCLQQTGNFCPSMSNGPAAMSGNTTAASTAVSSTAAFSALISSTPTSQQAAALDAFFALVGQEDDLGLLAT
jgi:hypothetical protein